MQELIIQDQTPSAPQVTVTPLAFAPLANRLAALQLIVTGKLTGAAAAISASQSGSLVQLRIKVSGGGCVRADVTYLARKLFAVSWAACHVLAKGQGGLMC